MVVRPGGVKSRVDNQRRRGALGSAPSTRFGQAARPLTRPAFIRTPSNVALARGVSSVAHEPVLTIPDLSYSIHMLTIWARPASTT